MIKNLEINENINEDTEIVDKSLIEPKSVLEDEEEKFYDYSEDISNSDGWAPLNIAADDDLEVIKEDNLEKEDWYPEWEKLEQKTIYSSNGIENQNENESAILKFEPLISDDKTKNTNDNKNVTIDPTFAPLGEQVNLSELETVSIDDLMFVESMMRDLAKLEDSEPEIESNEEIESSFEEKLDEEEIAIDNKITENFIETEKENEQPEDTDETEEYIDESVFMTEVTELDKEKLKLFENISSLVSASEENRNRSVEGTSAHSEVKALESLEILYNYVLLTNGLDEVTEDEYENIDSYIEETESEYTKLFNEKTKHLEDEKIRIKEITALIDGSYNIPGYVSKGKIIMDEYEKINFEYEKEKDDYNKICNSFKKMVETEVFTNDQTFTEEITGFIEQGYPKEKIEYLLTKYGKSIDKPEKIIEGLRQISKAKWNVEAYQEYIDEFFPEEYIENLKENRSFGRNDLEYIKEFEKTREDYVSEIFEAAKIDNDGNILYDIEKSDNELIGKKHQLDHLNNHVKFLADNIKVHPKKLYNEIKELIENNGDKELIESKLSLLLKFIHTDKIESTLTTDKKMHDNINEDIVKLTREKEKKEKLLAELKKQHDEFSYENDTTYLSDMTKLQKYISKDKELDLEIAKTKLIMNKGENFKKFTIANIVIAVKEKEKKKLNKLRKKSQDDSEKIQEIDRKIALIDKIIHKYRQDRIRYFHDIHIAKGFVGKDKLEKLIKQKEKNQKLITKITNEIEDKKKNYGYIDQDLRISLEEDIDSLDIEINTLKNIQEKMNYKTVEELAENVLNYDKKLDKKNVLDNIGKLKETYNLSDDKSIEESDEKLEEIADFKEPKKGLLAKIKSIDFKKIASSAITKITLAVATVAMGVGLISGIHSIKNDNVTKNDDLSKSNNTDKIVQEFDDYQDETIEDEINKEVNKENSSVEITVSNPEKTEESKIEEESEIEENNVIDTSENDFVNISKIATNSEKAARGEYVPEEQINEERFSNENIKRVEYMQVDDQLIRKVYAKDGTSTGTVIGFENVTDVETSSKTR